ncbi:MAG: M14 family metallopeptidase [Acidobacteriota bacterium]|nr:M14 family metallopeptidase [Acidobacteriota bacterium]MDH3529605.1 M14 family metallopeptidase [Acidobacteriota bacterium]
MNFKPGSRILSLSISVLIALSVITSGQSNAENVPAGWETFAEYSGYAKTPLYAETVSFARRLDSVSGKIVYRSFGKSSEGRDLPLLIASQDQDATPSGARKSGKAVVLIQAAIHAGESDGKDAGLALFRDLAVTEKHSGLLENTIILFVPIYNVDGHEMFGKFNRINQNGPEEMGFRANSAYQNLNRDYLKADTPETRAWLSLWNEWDPDFFIDCHVTDGADFRYNITYEFAHHDEIHTGLRNWMARRFEENAITKIEASGNLLSRYIQMLDPFAPERGIATFIATPRFATGYTPLRGRIGLLIEAHSVKPYKTRVRGTYDVLWRTLEEIANDKDALFAANRAADRETLELGSGRDDGTFVLSQRISNKTNDYTFKGFEIETADSPVSGGKKLIYTRKPKDYLIPQYDEAVPVVEIVPPRFYIVPPQWREVIDRLSAHGVEMWRLDKELTIKTELYRLDSPVWRPFPFEGRLTLSFKSEKMNETRTFPANSAVIPVSQRSGRVAMHFLEPAGPDSAVFWGFFNSIFEQKEYSESYVMEDIAAEMLKKDPDLEAEFNEKLKDAAFASDPRARLRFFYERSPYFDKRIGEYPVGRIVDNKAASFLAAQEK